MAVTFDYSGPGRPRPIPENTAPCLSFISVAASGLKPPHGRFVLPGLKHILCHALARVGSKNAQPGLAQG